MLHDLSASQRECLERTAIVARFNEDLAATPAEKLNIRHIIAELVLQSDS